MTFEEWFEKNEEKLPAWYSNPYDEVALKIAYEAGLEQGKKIGRDKSYEFSAFD